VQQALVACAAAVSAAACCGKDFTCPLCLLLLHAYDKIIHSTATHKFSKVAHKFSTNLDKMPQSSPKTSDLAMGLGLDSHTWWRHILSCSGCWFCSLHTWPHISFCQLDEWRQWPCLPK